ncbi:MAG: YfjI family protein [Chlamydiales bacterium]
MTTSYDWQAPIPLGAIDSPSFPEGVFPDAIEKFVGELSRSTETPRDLAGLTILAALATASHNKYVVQVKSDYREPVNLWTAVALPPGSRKSAVLAAAIKPIEKYEKQKQKLIEPLIKEITSRNKSLEVRIRELRNMVAKAKECDFEALQQEIFTLEEKIEEPPAFPQLWTSDVTPENLGTLMVLNHECMAVLSDEAGIFDILAGRYSSGIPNLDLFLKSHTGSPARVNRMGRPPDLLERAILTMGLTPQPDVLKGLGKNRTFRGRGLLGRFLYAMPRSNLGKRDLNASPMLPEVEAGYHRVLEAILEHEMSGDAQYALNLSPEAYEKWFGYSRAIEIQMDEGGPLAFMTDWAGKLAGQIARIGALIHIARYASEKPWMQAISMEDMGAAIKIGHYLSKHAQAVFDLMGADPALEGAKAVLRWVAANRYESFTFRDCQYAHKSRFKKAKELQDSIEVLLDNYFIIEAEQEKKTGRPSRVLYVNPYIFCEDK